MQHQIPTNVHIQQQFDQLSAQMPSSQSTHSISSSPIPSQKQIECHASPGSPALKSLFRTLRVGSLKHQPSSPINQPTLQEQADILNQKSAINTSSIVRTASTSTFKPASATTAPNEVKSEYPNCINQLQSTAQMAVQSNLTSFTGTLSSPANQPNGGLVMRNNRLNASQQSIKSNIVRGSKPCLSTFKDFQSDTNSENIKCDIISSNPIPCKRRTIQPTLSCHDNQLKSSDSSTSISLSSFNRQRSLKTQHTYTQDENEYDDIDSSKADLIGKEVLKSDKRESQEDEMQQIVNYINDFENSISVGETKVDTEPNTTLIQSIVDDEEPSKLRLSSSSLSSSADSLVDEAPKIDRRTYIVNKLYDNLEKTTECYDDGDYAKVIIGTSLDSDYDNDLLVNSEDKNVMYVSANSNAHIYENPIQIRDSTGFEVESIMEKNSENKGEPVYENLDFDNQLVELKNQIKQLLTESAECEQEIKQQITRTTSADNEIKRRAPLCKSTSNDQITQIKEITKEHTELNSVKSKIKLMESIVSSKLQKGERSLSSSSSCSSSRSPPASPQVKPLSTSLVVNDLKQTDFNEKRKTVKELLSKFEQSGHN